MRVKSAVKRVFRFLCTPQMRTISVPHLTDTSALLAGRTALITGASGSVGGGIARAFVKAGATVILAGRSELQLCQLALDLGGRAKPLTLDLTKPETFADCLEGLRGDYPDILVNSGGVLSSQTFGEIDLQRYDDVMNTNVRGMLFLSQEVSNAWKARGVKGNILNISSGSQYKPGWTPYQVSKNAVDSLTRGMAATLVDYDIVVNAIAPGPVSGPMLGIDPKDLTYPTNPSRRAVTPEEIAAWSTFLVSDLGRYAVGSTFALTGGNGFFQWERQENWLR